MDYADAVNELRLKLPELAEQFQGFDSVMQVVDWVQAQGSDKPTLDFVSHDEFSYDFLIQRDSGAWLVFGVN